MSGLELAEDADVSALKRRIEVVPNGFVVTPELLYDIMLGILSLKALQSMTIKRARQYCIKYKPALIESLRIYLERNQEAKPKVVVEESEERE